MAETVRVAIDAGLATLWLERAHGNAINRALAEDLIRACAELERAGFDDLARRSCGDSDIPGIEGIDWPDRFENALCMEGRRA